MLAFAVQVIEVKSAEAGSAVDLGAVLIAGAAAFAALLATISASLRLNAQLRHDRELREREHTRTVLDSQIDHAQSSARALTRFRSMIDTKEETFKRNFLIVREPRSEDDNDSDAAAKKKRANQWLSKFYKESSEARAASHEARLEGRAGTARLRLRFGRKSEIVLQHAKYVEAYSELHELLASASVDPRGDVERATADEAGGRVRQAYRAFHQACEDWFLAESKPKARRPRLQRILDPLRRLAPSPVVMRKGE